MVSLPLVNYVQKFYCNSKVPFEKQNLNKKSSSKILYLMLVLIKNRNYFFVRYFFANIQLQQIFCFSDFFDVLKNLVIFP